MTMNCHFLLSVVINLLGVVICEPGNLKISIIAVTQPLAKYFTERYSEFQRNTSAQTSSLQNAEVKLFHTNFNDESSGDWTISPLFMRQRSFFESQDWVVVCTEDTRLDIQGLVTFLSKFNPKESLLIGHGFYDQNPTIIHHFAFFEQDPQSPFQFPNRNPGYLISLGLLTRLIRKWESNKEEFDFKIDVDYEIAKLAKDSFNVDLHREDSLFCLGPRASGCVTWVDDYYGLQKCVPHNTKAEVFFAVKTCAKFFNDRVPVIKNTWGKLPSQYLGFFADVLSESVPTIRLPVKNHDQGHCGKLREILRWFRKERPNFAWLVIADDDTLLSVHRMRNALACLDDQEPIIFGERYGYRTPEGHGYDYVTGGGSIVLSSAAVVRIVEALETGDVRCQADDSPDDMALGIWATRLQIPILHSSVFHQARPADYPEKLLQLAPPLTFHKFWNCDPLEIFKTWFASSKTAANVQQHRGDEL